MKVLLVPPVFHYADNYPSFLSISDFPTGFGYLAASLKKAGHEVIGFNPNNITGYPSAKIMLADVLSQKIRASQPDLIGLGGLCTDYAFLKDAISICRSNSKAKIVLGGQIVTNDAEFIFNDLKPDYAIIGEADNAICGIATDLPEPGILRAQVIEDLNSLPFPDYEPFGVQDMLDNYSFATRLLYRYSRPDPRPFVIVASRSCPFTCTFCVHHHRSIPYRARSIPNIMAEIKETYEKYHYNILIIDDELFAVDKKRMREFCGELINNKAKYGWDFDWMFQTHASAKLDIETLKLAKSTGCNLFSYGLESASPTVLKSMNKKIEVSQVIEAMRLAKESGIGFSANLIFGDVAETEGTWAESLSFWFEHCKEHFVFLGNLMPYPGSKLFDDFKVNDKKKFYENIDKGAPNLTKIPTETFAGLVKLTAYLENSWLFARPANKVSIEVGNVTNKLLSFTGEKIHKIKATCPYCGKESIYHQPMKPEKVEHFMLGIGCVHCGRKVKVMR